MSTGQLSITGINPSDVRSIALDLDLETCLVQSFQEAKEGLEHSPPLCFILDCQDPAGKEVCQGVRLSTSLANVPIVGMVSSSWSREVSECFALGVDDYLPKEGLPLLKQKILALHHEGAPTGTYLSGKVILADPDRERRVHLARHMRKMGLVVDFAVDGSAIPSDVGVKMVVADCNLMPDGAVACLRRYRSGAGGRIPWVISGKKDELEAARGQLSDQSHISFLGHDSDPAQIAFTANQLLIGTGRSMRRSPRLTYETSIVFDAAAGGHREWGYTYNVNRGGLYIRTLTPPALGVDLVLEFVPPHGRGRVIVDAKVVWRQEYSGTRGYPPGFGVQYSESSPLADVGALEAGYNKLLEDNGNPSV